MSEPKQQDETANSTGTMTDAEFFGVPDLPRSRVTIKSEPESVNPKQCERRQGERRKKTISIVDCVFWKCAFTAWHETGDRSEIIKLLRGEGDIPQDAREGIADILEEKFKKFKRNPKLEKARRLTRNNFIRGNYDEFSAVWKQVKKADHNRNRKLFPTGETPASMAKKSLAEIYGLRVSTIEKILKARKKG